MKKLTPLLFLFAALAALLFTYDHPTSRSVSMAQVATAGKQNVVHNVYFTLNENTPANRLKLLAACKKYLTDHQGVVYYSTGVLAESLTRPVNDREWDVGLHIVFKTMADHDVYQTHPRHLQFIEENKATWKKVRVFDTEVE